MPIPIKDINTNIIQITPEETIGEVLMWLPVDRAARALCYVVLAVEGERYIVIQWLEVEQIATCMNQHMRSMRIAALPGLPSPVAAIERYSTDITWAREKCNRLPSKRLVVLTNGVVVGLLTTETWDMAVLPADPFVVIGERSAFQDGKDETAELPPSPRSQPTTIEPRSDDRRFNARVEGLGQNKP